MVRGRSGTGREVEVGSVGVCRLAHQTTGRKEGPRRTRETLPHTGQGRVPGGTG